MRGICSECGLGFNWGDVLHPTGSVPRWAVEHPQGFTLGRAAACFVRALMPWTLWKRIRIEQPIRLRALAWFIVLHLLLLHVCVGLTVSIVTYIELGRWGAPNSRQRVWEAAHPMLWPYSTLPGGWYWGASEVGVQCLALLSAAVAMPMAFLALGYTLARAKVRKVHLLRAFALTLPAPIIGSIAGVLVNARFSFWGGGLEFFRPLLGLGAEVWVTWAALLVFFWSWWMIVSRYLRLEQPRAVMLAMTTIALLTSFASVTWTSLAAW